jgi:hypothetical protein
VPRSELGKLQGCGTFLGKMGEADWLESSLWWSSSCAPWQWGHKK